MKIKNIILCILLLISSNLFANFLEELTTTQAIDFIKNGMPVDNKLWQANYPLDIKGKFIKLLKSQDYKIYFSKNNSDTVIYDISRNTKNVYGIIFFKT